MLTAIISIGLGQVTATTLFLAWWLPGLDEEQIPVPAPLPAALVQAALPAGHAGRGRTHRAGRHLRPGGAAVTPGLSGWRGQ